MLVVFVADSIVNNNDDGKFKKLKAYLETDKIKNLWN